MVFYHSNRKVTGADTDISYAYVYATRKGMRLSEAVLEKEIKQVLWNILFGHLENVSLLLA